MNIINSIPHRKELWSWNKNQNVALEQMKANTMVMSVLDYAIASFLITLLLDYVGMVMVVKPF